VAALSAPLWMQLFGFGSAMALTVVLMAMVFWRHGANIARLRAGTEPKIGKKG